MAGVALSVVLPSSAGAGIEVGETKVITPEHDSYHGWGTVTKRANGELVAVFSGGREDHVCPFGRLESMVSRDEGKTWSWPRVLMDSATDDRDGGIAETKNGTLLAVFFTSVAYQQHLAAPERRIGKVFGRDAAGFMERSRLAELRLTPGERQSDVGYWLLRSTDGGLTWSQRMPMPCYSPHGPTAMADGRVFYAASNGRNNGAWVSNDDGLSWALLSEIPGRPGETHGIEAADGTLVVHVRDKVAPPEGGKKRWATVQWLSHDGGKTWDGPREIAEGFPSHLQRLRDGRLLMTYGVRKEPFGIRARISADHGKTWSEEMVLTNDAATEDMGYPSTVQLNDGSLLTVWYEVPAGSRNAQLRQAKWKITE